MAIDKSRTAPIVKVGIGVLAIFLVVAMSSAILPGFVQLLGGSQEGSDRQRSGSGLMERAVGEYSSQVMGIESVLESDPTSHTLLVALANAYSDWASEVDTTAGDPLTASLYREKAIGAYERALKVDPNDAAVAVDYAISLFYDRRAGDAAKVIDGVLAKDPGFVPALFNGGIFYAEAGRYADSVRVLEQYLKADPNGAKGNPDVARQIIKQVSAQKSQPATP